MEEASEWINQSSYCYDDNLLSAAVRSVRLKDMSRLPGNLRGSFWMAVKHSSSVGASKGGYPQSIMYMTMPSDQISHFSS